jgi:hypothetical protein
MPTDWQTPYQAALRERDPAELHEACKRARVAIHQRALELKDINPADALTELQQLESALNHIWVHGYASRSDQLPPATDWRTPYQAALRERDPAKLHEACELARRGIHDRTLELAAENATDSPEREELEEALRQIFIHEQKSQRPG